MTYAIAAALQEAVFTRISTDPGVIALVGSAIYDALPSGSLPATYVTLGPEQARDRSDQTARGAEHDFVLSVNTELAGFASAKAVAAALNDALFAGPLTLARGRLVALNFLRAQARLDGAIRRIEIRFRARVDDI